MIFKRSRRAQSGQANPSPTANSEVQSEGPSQDGIELMSQQEVGAEPAAIESGRRREVGWWRRPWWDWDPNEEPLHSIS